MWAEGGGEESRVEIVNRLYNFIQCEIVLCAILFFNVGLPVRLEEFRQAETFKADPVRKKISCITCHSTEC